MRKISERIVFEGAWLRVKESVFINDRGEEVRWESVARNKQVKGIAVIARMEPSGRYILIKQFRHALDKYVIGMPAGLADDGGAEHALVELEEETGYHGRITGVSPELKTSAGMVDDTTMAVFVEVDENDPRNKDPRQKLESCEEIEVILLRKEEVRGFLTGEKEKGTEIGAGMWYLFCVDLP
jgi:ADP-ribose pyrophosphatase